MVEKMLGHKAEAQADLQSLKDAGGAVADATRRSLQREIAMIDEWVADFEQIRVAVEADAAMQDDPAVFVSGEVSSVSLDPPEHPIIETPRCPPSGQTSDEDRAEIAKLDRTHVHDPAWPR